MFLTSLFDETFVPFFFRNVAGSWSSQILPPDKGVIYIYLYAT